MKKWNDYVAPVTQIIDVITSKEFCLCDGIKAGTALATQWKTQNKLLGGLKKVYKTVQSQARQFAAKNPFAAPEQYISTPQGLLLKASQNLPPPDGSLPSAVRTSMSFVANHPEITALAQKAQLWIQPAQETLQAIGKQMIQAPEKFFRHIFAAELIEKTNLAGQIKRSLSGFHHYTVEYLQEMKITLQNSKLCQKTGLVLADVVCNGHIEKKKTFFPTSWTRERVIEKIAEAIKKPVDMPLIEGKRCVVFGKTSENIIVKIVLAGNYITAYPDAVLNGLI